VQRPHPGRFTAAADALLAQLKAGADFVQMAQQSSKDSRPALNGGDMDWFPRGWLPSKEVEDAAFCTAARPDQRRGADQRLRFPYHSSDRARSQSGTAHLKSCWNSEKQAIEKWLAGLRAAAKVERLGGQIAGLEVGGRKFNWNPISNLSNLG